MGKVTVKGLWKPSPTPADDIDPYRRRWVNDDENRRAVQFVRMPTKEAWTVQPECWSQAEH